MGYSHGKKWDEKTICDEILKIVAKKGDGAMPTHSEMFEWAGNTSLPNAVSKHGGTRHFAKLLGLGIKSSETKFGNDYEDLCVLQIEDILSLPCQKMTTRYPYDILVNRTVKIDVKSGRVAKFRDGKMYYTFNIEKTNQTCDIFVCYCVSEDCDKIHKTLVIPSYVLSGKSQLSIGIKKSIYDKYIDGWRFISEYDAFIRKLV